MYNYQAPRRRHRGLKLVAWLAAVLVLLVGLDFGARAYAESLAATQIQKDGFPKKPDVSIGGFPFLTQALARHFGEVTITSSDIPAGLVTITSIRLTADDVRLNSSYSGGTAGPLRGTLLISLGELGSALSALGPLASFLGASAGGLRISAVGTSEVKGSLTLAGGVVSWSATWQVVAAGPHEIDLRLVSGAGLPAAVRSAVRNVRLPLSSLPAGLRLTGGLNSSASGITAQVYARSLTFGQ